MNDEEHDLFCAVAHEFFSEERVIEWATAEVGVPLEVEIEPSLTDFTELRNELSPVEDGELFRRSLKIWDSREEAFSYAARPRVDVLVLIDESRARNWYRVSSLKLRETTRRLRNYLNDNDLREWTYEALQETNTEKYHASNLTSLVAESRADVEPVVLATHSAIGICEWAPRRDAWDSSIHEPAMFFAGIVGTDERNDFEAAADIFHAVHEFGGEELVDRVCAKFPDYAPTDRQVEAGQQVFEDAAPPDWEPDSDPAPPRVILGNDDYVLLAGRPESVIEPGEYSWREIDLN